MLWPRSAHRITRDSNGDGNPLARLLPGAVGHNLLLFSMVILTNLLLPPGVVGHGLLLRGGRGRQRVLIHQQQLPGLRDRHH